MQSSKKNGTLTQGFSCELCEIFKNTPVAASVNILTSWFTGVFRLKIKQLPIFVKSSTTDIWPGDKCASGFKRKPRILISKPAFTCLKSTIETPEQYEIWSKLMKVPEERHWRQCLD